jgi:ElaB/YqjD/DUF883 family membrane-anchored ribosome-binding protein
MALPDLKPSPTEEAFEEAVRAAKRAIKQGVHDLEDWRDAAALKVRHSPFKAVGLALGVGVALGAAAVWMAGMLARRKKA